MFFRREKRKKLKLGKLTLQKIGKLGKTNIFIKVWETNKKKKEKKQFLAAPALAPVWESFNKSSFL